MKNTPFDFLKKKRNEKGSILVLVLIIVASMAALSLGLAYRSRIEIRLATSKALNTKAYHIALGGIERIKVLMKEGGINGQDDKSQLWIAKNCPFSSSASSEGLLKQLPGHNSLNVQLSYSLHDEKEYFNINESSFACWLKFGGIPEGELVSIVDWLDEDNDRTVFDGAEGAEADFYEKLETPYKAKNGPSILLRELLFVKGINKQRYLGEDQDHDLSLDENERDGGLKKPLDNSDDILDLGLIDIFTARGDKKMNINTVSRRVLAALFSGHGEDESVADAVIAHREQFEDDMCFEEADDLSQVPGLTDTQLGILTDCCCYNSDSFRIFSYARIGNIAECHLMATAECTDNELRILYIEKLI